MFYLRYHSTDMKRMKSFLKLSLLGCLALVAMVAFCDSHISSYSAYSFDEISKVDRMKVGLVLGTSKYTAGGRENIFYRNRMDAAIDLYTSCKIEKIIVSGDNGTHAYNEPRMMFQDLVKAGIPAENIYLDYAGFRTLDSVVRAHKIFNQSSFLIISQSFHNERALFIARSKGIEASAFNARAVSFGLSPKTYVREKLARVKAVLDIYLLGTSPKFLGEKEVIS